MTEIPSRSDGPTPAGPPEQDGPSCTGYERPRLTVLGTVSEVTQGGTVSGNSDGYGFAGASGVIS
jgi:hypothetical protein